MADLPSGADDRASRVGRGARVGLVVIAAYRALLSPILGGSCRFTPSCSEYAEEALRRHGACRGGLLAVARLARCHPLGGWGLDPVPDGLPSSVTPNPVTASAGRDTRRLS